MEDSLVARRPKRSTAGNRMEAALAEMSVDDLMRDVEEDVDFISKVDEEDVFESDFASTDEDADEEDAGEKILQDEEKRAKRAARRVFKVPTAPSVRKVAFISPRLDEEGADTSTLKGKPKFPRRVALGQAIDAETGEILESSKRQSARQATRINTQELQSRLKSAEGKKATITKRPKEVERRKTQADLIAAALDMEEDNVKSHREYLAVEEEKRKKARVVKPTTVGPKVRWRSRMEEVTITVYDPAPSLQQYQMQRPTWSSPYVQPPNASPQPGISYPNPYMLPPAVPGQTPSVLGTPATPTPPAPAIPVAAASAAATAATTTTTTTTATAPTAPATTSPATTATSSSSTSALQPSQALVPPPHPPPPAHYSYTYPTTLSQPTSVTPVPSSSKQSATGTATTTPAASAQTPYPSYYPYSYYTAQTQTPHTPYQPYGPYYAYQPTPGQYQPAVPRPHLQLHPQPQVARKTTVKQAKNYVEVLLDEERPQAKPSWRDTMDALFGKQVDWDKVRVYVGKNRPIARQIQTCPITGLQARYRDPRTGVPYANAGAFRILTRLLAQEYVWSPGAAPGGVGVFLGHEKQRGAVGVPDSWGGAMGGVKEGWRKKPVEVKKEEKPKEKQKEVRIGGRRSSRIAGEGDEKNEKQPETEPMDVDKAIDESVG